MPYNPGITAHGGQLLGAGLGRGLQQLADSNKQVAEILNRKEEQAKADRQMAKAFGTIIKADETTRKILSERIGIDPNGFGDLALDDQLAIAQAILRLPGYVEASANAGIRQNQQGLTAKELEAWSRSNAIKDGYNLAQLARQEGENVMNAAKLPYAEDLAENDKVKSDLDTRAAFLGLDEQGIKNKFLSLQSQSYLAQLENEKIQTQTNRQNAESQRRNLELKEAENAVKLGRSKWSPAQFIKLSPDQITNRLMEINNEYGPEEFAMAMRAATEAWSFNDMMRDKSIGRSAPVNGANRFLRKDDKAENEVSWNEKTRRLPEE